MSFFRTPEPGVACDSAGDGFGGGERVEDAASRGELGGVDMAAAAAAGAIGAAGVGVETGVAVGI